MDEWKSCRETVGGGGVSWGCECRAYLDAGVSLSNGCCCFPVILPLPENHKAELFTNVSSAVATVGIDHARISSLGMLL